MRIDPTLVVAAIPKDKSDIPAPKRTATGSSSIVSLSAAATSASAASASTEPAAADPARLAKIKMQIEKGTYPIDLDKLASRIVEDDEGRSK